MRKNKFAIAISVVTIASFAIVMMILTAVKKNSFVKVAKQQLIIEVRRGGVDAVENLLTEYRLNPDSVDDDGQTLLIVAIGRKDDPQQMRLIKTLLIHGADVNHESLYGGYPVVATIQDGNFNIYRLLIEHGATVSSPNNYTCWAAMGGNNDIVNDLINRGANVNYYDSNGVTPLHCASNAKVTDYLIAKGADINAKDKYVTTGGVDLNTTIVDDGATPLHMAIKGYKVDVVQTLLAHGADKTIVNRQGLTPRELAVRLGYNDIVEMLDKQ